MGGNWSTRHQREPNSKDMWPSNVLIFHDEMEAESIKERIKPTSDSYKENVPYVPGDPGPWPDPKEPLNTYSSKEKHFTNERYVLFFEPGTYKNVDFEVGYYVQVAGLGASADEVEFVSVQEDDKLPASGPFVESLNKDLPYTNGGTIFGPGSGLCLDTFWRSAENFKTSTKGVAGTGYPAKNTGMVWAVSQASPLRRVHVNTDLFLCDGGAYASGGVLANAVVEGKTSFGPQQQWISRNVEFKGGQDGGGAWNMVYSGCTGDVPPQGVVTEDGKNQATTVEETPMIRVEKPFVTLEDERFKLRVPAPSRDLVTGPQIGKNESDAVRDFQDVKLGIPNKSKDPNDEVAYNTLTDEDKKKTMELQTALDEGKDLVLCPGEFYLTKTLEIRTPNQVILGLGMATLVAPQDGSPCIHVAPKTPGVRIAGIMLEASLQVSSESSGSVASLLEYGSANVIDPGDKNNPGVLTDISGRVGGANLNRSVSTDVMIRIHSGNVVGDNLWLWRADHVQLKPGEEPNDKKFPYYHQVRENECHVNTALEVHGDDVIIYGLFCEHTLQHQMIWKGERGRVTLFQCELPYDVAPENFDGYTGYYVHHTVNDHKAKGIGVYSNFTVYDVNASTGIVHPDVQDLVHPFTVFLSNKGSIQTVLNNNEGSAVSEENKGPSRV